MDSDGKRRDAVEVVEVGTKNSTASMAGDTRQLLLLANRYAAPLLVVGDAQL